MTRIAHLTDLHLLEDDHEKRTWFDKFRLSYLSFGRPRRAQDRRNRTIKALGEALLSGADHLLLTGDLTEDGLEVQFEILGQVLQESGWPPSRVTIVPGNHDLYGHPKAWEKALAGPLLNYAETSSPGSVTVLQEATIVAVNTARYQSFAFSSGFLRNSFESLLTATKEAKHRGHALVLAQHHSPVRRSFLPLQWIDGLVEHIEMMSFLKEHENVHVLHGHDHEQKNDPVVQGGLHRIFGAEAVVASKKPLRLYRANQGVLTPEI